MRILISNNTNKYRKQTHSSYKQMTMIEQKQKQLLSMIKKCKYKAKILSDLRFISNEIASNCLYHDKNINEQFKNFDKLKVPKDEQELLSGIWDMKFNIGMSLQRDMKEVLNFVKETNNDKQK